MRLLVAIGVVLALALPAGASAATLPVSVQFQAFGPSELDVLPGETVEWDNVSERTHTVTADDASFDSGDLDPEAKFSVRFDAPASIPYHCTKHEGMVGEIDVQPVILGPLPTAPIPVGDRVEFEGRTSDPLQPVVIQRSTGGDFRAIASAMPAADGTWTTMVPAQATGDYRASIGPGVSKARRLIVSDRKVLVRATRTGIAVTVVPALPYARVMLQEDLPERFGWWPSKLARLDYVSAATFKVARPARVRAVLVDRDGWTPLAISRTVTLGHARRSRPAPAMPMHH